MIEFQLRKLNAIPFISKGKVIIQFNMKKVMPLIWKKQMKLMILNI